MERTNMKKRLLAFALLVAMLVSSLGDTFTG